MFLAIVATTFLAVVAAAGYWGMSFESSGREILENQALLRTHLQTANARDAIRGDVFAALEVGTQKASSSTETISKDAEATSELTALEKNLQGQFQQHKSDITANLKELSTNASGIDVKKALASSAENLVNYVSSSEQLIALALSYPESARLSLQSFLSSYTELEGSLKLASDALLRQSTYSLETERATAMRNRSVIVTIATLALVTLSVGIGQLREAMSQIETSTQQNAALVEQATASADSIEQQARRLVELSTVFNTGAHHDVEKAAPTLATRERRVTPLPRQAIRQNQSSGLAAVEDDWKSF